MEKYYFTFEELYEFEKDVNKHGDEICKKVDSLDLSDKTKNDLKDFINDIMIDIFGFVDEWSLRKEK